MTGEAESGNFTYETRPLAGAEYTITAAEDIYTQDRQLITTATAPSGTPRAMWWQS